jgi:hypothetical protein
LKKHKIEFSQSAGKVLDRIYRRDKNLYFRLIGILESVALNPQEGKKLKGHSKDIIPAGREATV